LFRNTVKSRWLGADGVYRRRLASLARDRAGVSFRPEEREKSAARYNPRSRA
jgi:hypothetical protein